MTPLPIDGMKPAISLTKAMRDERLLGGPFVSPSFWTWFTFAKLIDGLPLDEAREVELFRQCTGRTRLPDWSGAAWHPAVWPVVAVARTGSLVRWRCGEPRCALTGASTSAPARVLFVCCSVPINVKARSSPVLRGPAAGAAADGGGRAADRRGGRSFATAHQLGDRAPTMRGSCAGAAPSRCLGSEASHWKTDEYAASSDEEVVGAAEPSLSMCPDGGLLMLGSSVHRKRGYMYRKYKQLHGNDDGEDLCWFAPSARDEPEATGSRWSSKALADDAPRARAEYLNVFREDMSDFVPVDVIEACTDFGTPERAPVAERRGQVHCVLRRGWWHWTRLVYAWRSRIGKSIAGLAPSCSTWCASIKPRFVPAAVVAEFAAILKLFGITEVQGDGFAGGFHADEWAQPSDQVRGRASAPPRENYLALLPLLLQPGRVRLCDSPVLRQQLAGLERRVHAGVRGECVARTDPERARRRCGQRLRRDRRCGRASRLQSLGPGVCRMRRRSCRRLRRCRRDMPLEQYERITCPPLPDGSRSTA